MRRASAALSVLNRGSTHAARAERLLRGMLGRVDDTSDDIADPVGDSPLLRIMNEMNESIQQVVEEQFATVDDADVRNRALNAFAARLPDLFDRTGDRIVSNLFASAPAMLARHKALEDAYAVEVEKRWGDALGAYRMLWAACHENGAAFGARHFNVDRSEPSPTLHAQIGLQARACRVALEVLALLRDGLGAGALARARTLHEITTISAILATYGAPDGDHADLAERYLLHANVVSWLDAVEYQEVAPKLGYEPYTDAELAELAANRDAVVHVYGDPFGKPNGWAACLMPNQKAPRSFKDLELLAGADHMRSHYSWASHEVHADARSWMMNHETIGDVTFRNTGPSPRGMADAAQIALISLNQVTINTLFSEPEARERPADVIAGLTLNKLVGRACDAFVAADEAEVD